MPTRNMADKSMTIGEVEELKTTLSNTIADAIRVFEEATGMRIGYINTVRKRDAEERGTMNNPVYPSDDRGDVISVEADLDMEI